MVGDINLITTIIGFGMSSTFIVFVCTRLICGRLRMVESSGTFDTEPETDLEQPEQSTDAAEPVVLAAIPTMKFHHDAFSSMEDVQCSICLGEYQEKEVLRIMPNCGHSFHLSCIDLWLVKQSTCPVCRLPLTASFDQKFSRLNSIDVARSEDDDAQMSTEDLNQSSTAPGFGHSARNFGRQQPRQSTSRNPELNSAGE